MKSNKPADFLLTYFVQLCKQKTLLSDIFQISMDAFWAAETNLSCLPATFPYLPSFFRAVTVTSF